MVFQHDVKRTALYHVGLRALHRMAHSNVARCRALRIDYTIAQLRGLIGVSAFTSSNSTSAAPLTLSVIQAGTGNTIVMVPVDDVLYFEAADKYVRVVTQSQEHLIRTSLRELHPQLDQQRFWQIHRGTIVRYAAIDSAQRHDSGKLTLTLKNHSDKLTVSRLYAHLFKGM